MQFEDGPQLELTARRKILVGLGAAMFIAQSGGALIAAPALTGENNAHGGALVALWFGSILWSAVATLLLIRQADLPDVATASFIVTITAFAAFALSAAYDARGTKAEVNLVDALFLGVTAGGLTALLVWALALGTARLLKLPTTEGMRATG